MSNQAAALTANRVDKVNESQLANIQTFCIGYGTAYPPPVSFSKALSKALSKAQS